MKQLTIRQANQNDVSAVHQMQIAWAEEDITYGFEPGSADYISSNLGPYFLVAEIGTDIVGFAYGSVRTAEDAGFCPDGTEFFNIDDLYVAPQYRSHGIGEHLMRDLTGRAEDHGIRRFAVSSNTKDLERVVKFYRSCGFQTWNVTMFRTVKDG